jgi:hypothetical protein
MADASAAPGGHGLGGGHGGGSVPVGGHHHGQMPPESPDARMLQDISLPSIPPSPAMTAAGVAVASAVPARLQRRAAHQAAADGGAMDDEWNMSGEIARDGEADQGISPADWDLTSPPPAPRTSTNDDDDAAPAPAPAPAPEMEAPSSPEPEAAAGLSASAAPFSSPIGAGPGGTGKDDDVAFFDTLNSGAAAQAAQAAVPVAPPQPTQQWNEVALDGNAPAPATTLQGGWQQQDAYAAFVPQPATATATAQQWPAQTQPQQAGYGYGYDASQQQSQQYGQYAYDPSQQQQPHGGQYAQPPPQHQQQWNGALEDSAAQWGYGNSGAWTPGANQGKY